VISQSLGPTLSDVKSKWCSAPLLEFLHLPG
jgi:hypothetical protein